MSSTYNIMHFTYASATFSQAILHLSLHDALTICESGLGFTALTQTIEAEPEDTPLIRELLRVPPGGVTGAHSPQNRKSTRLNSSHLVISYAVLFLKKIKIREFVTDDY